MANPNLLGISNVVGVTTNIVIGTTEVGTGYQTVLSNAESGKVYKIVSILAANKTTSNYCRCQLKHGSWNREPPPLTQMV